MIINLTKSKMFRQEPAKRFAKEYGVSEEVWLNIWIKYKVYDFEPKELLDYAHFKLGKPIEAQSLKRWIFRTEVYSIARDYIKVGGQAVVSSVFGKFEEDLIKELLQNMRFNGNKNSKSII